MNALCKAGLLVTFLSASTAFTIAPSSVQAQVALHFTQCVLTTTDGNRVAVGMASTVQQCNAYARQCGGSEFQSATFHAPAIALRDPFQVCTPNPAALLAPSGPTRSRCIVRLVNNTDLAIPRATSNEQCVAMAKACARRKTGKMYLQHWFNPDGLASPSSTCDEPVAPLTRSTEQPAAVERPRPQPFKITNACDEPIDVAISFLTAAQEWDTMAWWEVDPGNTTYLADASSRRVLSENSVWYWFAKSRSFRWTGTQPTSVDGEIVDMKRATSSGEHHATASCQTDVEGYPIQITNRCPVALNVALRFKRFNSFTSARHPPPWGGAQWYPVAAGAKILPAEGRFPIKTRDDWYFYAESEDKAVQISGNERWSIGSVSPRVVFGRRVQWTHDNHLEIDCDGIGAATPPPPMPPDDFQF